MLRRSARWLSGPASSPPCRSSRHWSKWDSWRIGQALGYELSTESSPWRLVPSLVVAGIAMGLLNALLGREAVASVEPDRAAIGSGANNTARYFVAAVGITSFVVIATRTGNDLAAGWNVAIVVSAAISLVGAGAVAIAGRASRIGAVRCATNGT